jgi:hypothetical protein
MKIDGQEISCAIKLFQPWAYEVVTGSMPYLLRSFNTLKRGKIGVIATNRVDRLWLENADNLWIDKIKSKLDKGLIGSVIIDDVICVLKGDIEDSLSKIAGKKYLSNYYPAYLMPSKKFKSYIWILKNPVLFKKSIPLKSKGGILWMRL